MVADLRAVYGESPCPRLEGLCPFQPYKMFVAELSGAMAPGPVLAVTISETFKRGL